MAFRSRPQTRFQVELAAPELEELARRYCWLRYLQTLGVYRRSPLALLGLAQGLRGPLGLGVASDLDALIVGGTSPLEHLYHPQSASLVDAVAMGLLANGHADAILGELRSNGSPMAQVELLGEAVRLGLRLVLIAEEGEDRAIDAASSLGWRIEHLNGGDLLEGWSLGRALWHGFQDVSIPVVVVVDGYADTFEIGELGYIAPQTLDRFEREAIEAASRLSADPRPQLARSAAKRRLATAMTESQPETLAVLATQLATRLGAGSLVLSKESVGRLDGERIDSCIRLSDPTFLAEALVRWGGFPVVIGPMTPTRSAAPGTLILTTDRDLRPGSPGVLVESQEEFLYFVNRLLGEEAPTTNDYLVVTDRFERDGFGRLEEPTGRWLRPPSDLVVITWGRGVQVALEACVFLGDAARDVGVLELHQPGLVDEKLIARAMRARRVCILYDVTPDVGYQLVTYMQEYFFAQLSAPVLLRSARPGPGPIAVVLRGLLA
ncbi:transketolase C-terminal domain-containing protein [Ferrimicrobium sp.]|uniref:transketolase C-terminal domain-containing protein n=1 Tax=Ferrimicrobium sp. TaxID=2926050 RepID=UPI00263649DB|nr:transketolase C-terminal domain-containing protein [Ferrimicrobium sp.]